jgi:hypothetical protein
MDANCTASGVFDAVFKPKTVMDFLQGGEPPVCETKIAGVSVIPACLNLVQINNLIDFQLRSSIRRSGLEGKFDLIVIDPPGYWGSHTRNAVFAADTIVVPGCCSRLDFCATETYLQTLEQCALDADLFVAVNAFDKRRSDMGALEDYRREFARYLAPEPVPASLTLKRVTADPARPMHPVTRKRLERFVSHITGGKFDEIRLRQLKTAARGWGRKKMRVKPLIDALALIERDHRRRIASNCFGKGCDACNVGEKAVKAMLGFRPADADIVERMRLEMPECALEMLMRLKGHLEATLIARPEMEF